MQLRLGPDRVTLADYLGKGIGPRTGMSWGVRVSGLGRSFVGTQHDDAGVATFLLAAVAHDDEAGTVARTTIAQQSGTLTIDFVRRELHETLAVRYAQRSGAILTVKRTRNRDGGVRYAAARSVDTLEQLARDHPCDHALLVSLLKQTNTVERAAAGGN